MKIESNISVCKIPGFYQDFIFAEKILFVKIYSTEVAVARYTLSLYIPAIAFFVLLSFVISVVRFSMLKLNLFRLFFTKYLNIVDRSIVTYMIQRV